MSYSHRVYKYFGAFIRQVARAKADKAIAVSIYVDTPFDAVSDVREHVAAAERKGNITHERKIVLDGLIEECFKEYMNGGRIVKELDLKDWRSLGNGGHQRINHFDSEKRK